MAPIPVTRSSLSWTVSDMIPPIIDDSPVLDQLRCLMDRLWSSIVRFASLRRRGVSLLDLSCTELPR